MSNCPFNNTQLALFETGLRLLYENSDLPEGYGVLEHELGSEGFNEQEEIIIGLQKRGYNIHLPNSVWKPRTQIWAQGLYVLNEILAIR